MQGVKDGWRIENETFNILKHNYKNLSTVMAFFVDQVLQSMNKKL